MNRSKTSACRQVGLSKRKTIADKTVENLLSTSGNTSSTDRNTPSSELKSQISNEIKQKKKITVDNDTPCRQVGLSRKRKTITPASSKKIKKDLLNTPLTSHKFDKVDSETCAKNETTCAKNLSDKFTSSTESHGKQADSLYETNSQKVLDETDNNSGIFSNTISNQKMSETKVNCEREKNASRTKNNSKNEKIDSQNIVERSSPNESFKARNEIETKVNMKTKLIDVNKLENLNSINIKENQFIKVNYDKENTQIDSKSSEKTGRKTSSKIENKTDNKALSKKSSSRYLDDDFDFSPIRKKLKNEFPRSVTDIMIQKNQKKTEPLKKPLSVGDNKFQRSMSSKSVTSDDSLSNCYVKLEKLNNSVYTEEVSKKKKRKTKSFDSSDDDFETLPLTPKETVQTTVNYLENEVKEKRTILDELLRAKSCKKLHNVQELNELTEKWKTGCIEALNDLSKQLNDHKQIDMATLLKKLDFPEDFICPSQT